MGLNTAEAFAHAPIDKALDWKGTDTQSVF